MSIVELRESNLKAAGPRISYTRDMICAKGHDYEWLCCGAIPDSRITGVWPWDGKALHYKDPGLPIRSFENSGQPWVWSWPKKMWLPDTFSTSAIAAQIEESGIKRKRTRDAATQVDDTIGDCKASKKRPLFSRSKSI